MVGKWLSRKFKKKREKFVEWIVEKKYTFLSLVGDGVGVDQSQRKDEIIVSLTSYPLRFFKLHVVLESLLRQSLKPSRIVVWLAREEVPSESELPTKLRKLKKRGVEFRFVEKNYKPYNKLIHSLREFPNALIVTCDDDTVYTKDFLKGLYTAWLRNPECIVSYACKVMVRLSKREFAPYKSWPFADFKGPSLILFPLGYSGVLYPPGSLSEEVFRDDIFLELSPYSDDIWFKAMALLKGTKAVMVSNRAIEFPTIRSVDRKGLHSINVAKGLNDIQLKRVFDYFDLYDKLEDYLGEGS